MKLTNEKLGIKLNKSVASKITPEGIKQFCESEGWQVSPNSSRTRFEVYNDDEFVTLFPSKVDDYDWYVYAEQAIFNVARYSGYTGLNILVKFLRASGEEVEL